MGWGGVGGFNNVSLRVVRLRVYVWGVCCRISIQSGWVIGLPAATVALARST